MRRKNSLKKDLGMACHPPPLKKAWKGGEMPLPSLPFNYVEFRNVMGLRLYKV